MRPQEKKQDRRKIKSQEMQIYKMTYKKIIWHLAKGCEQKSEKMPPYTQPAAAARIPRD